MILFAAAERMYTGLFFPNRTHQKKKNSVIRNSLNFLASPMRFERTTYRLGGGCSVQLSYGDSALIIQRFPVL